MARTTWDGLPISEEKPIGATIAVWRGTGGHAEWLILHRRHEGAEYEGDWAWSPPAGARLPGELLDDCARRELLEETGLELECAPTDCGSDDWAVYVAEAPPDSEVVVSPEHDQFLWLALEEAAAKCQPAVVASSLECVATTVVTR